MKSFYQTLVEWWRGKQSQPPPEQNIYRQQGKVEEDLVSYNEGFWGHYAKPFLKVVMTLSFIGFCISGAFAGRSYMTKAEAQADSIRAETEKNEECKSFIMVKRSDDFHARCKHKDQVLRIQWERGELTVQCLCPNSIKDHEKHPRQEPGPTPGPVEEPVQPGTLL